MLPSLPGQKIIDVPVDGAVFKLSGGISSVRSVAVQPNSGFSVFTCFIAVRRHAGCFAPPFGQSQDYASIPVPSGLYFPFCLSRFVPGLLIVRVWSSLLARNARCR